MSSTLERLRDLATAVAGALPCVDDVAGLSPRDETEAARLLGGIHAAVGGAISLLAADIDRRSARELGTDGLAQRSGFRDGAGLVQELTGVGRVEAARLIRVGELLATAEAVAPAVMAEAAAAPPARDIAVLAGLSGAWEAPLAVAVRNTWLTAAQGDALRTGLGEPRTPEFAGRWRRAVLALVSDCWSGHWSPEELAKAAKRARACLDTVAAQTEAQERYRGRSFTRSVRASGMVHYDIELDPESDARFYGPIRRILSPRFGGPRFVAADEVAAATALEEDPRTNAQLQADTLVELVERAVHADGRELFPSGEPHVMVAVTTADLQAARAGEGGIAWIDGRDEPITATDALRLICEAGFTPALFDETGQAIDVGRDRRYFTRVQRRALAKRDGGCRYPGCDRPPDECEAHHINPWAQSARNRRSEVRDGVLLCRRHHKMVHDFGARITREGAVYRLLWPGREPARLHSAAGIRAQLRAQGKTA
ncbi:MAG TPA: DUF222 domain-containing protein [Gryllotalpicola sp.]